MTATDASALSQFMAADWAEAMASVQPQIHAMGDFLRDEIHHGRSYLPAPYDIFRAFRQPMSQVRVLIVGQDPYPTPGHPVGLSFSVAPGVRPVPRSLQNIFAELHADVGAAIPPNGDLSPWADRGVMLLNRSLTVAPRRPASHRGKGWEKVTDAAIRALVVRRGEAGEPVPLVAILWGRDAQSLAPLLGQTPIIASPHPSPMSADRGFFGSRPFSRANAALVAQGAQPIDWSLA